VGENRLKKKKRENASSSPKPKEAPNERSGPFMEEKNKLEGRKISKQKKKVWRKKKRGLT